jgi:hypothetical protein
MSEPKFLERHKEQKEKIFRNKQELEVYCMDDVNVLRHTNVTSSVKINGQTLHAIPIKCAIRQGYPVSMQIFAICLVPLLTNLANVIIKVHIGRRTAKNTVMVYADNVTASCDVPTRPPQDKNTIRPICGSNSRQD